jgi:cysteinyl-tRNA synthetase
MSQVISLYNSLSRNKEVFEPINAPFVGMYLCGPTVYGDPHLGHARSATTFDIIYRYLSHCGYKVRYVRNITDVGHLENDADDGDDKIAKRARLEKLEPMEVVQLYTNAYHEMMDKLNIVRPSIEPRASAHIIEQIEMIEKIVAAGLAYVSNGSVYFDVLKYNESENYGELSGRILEDLIAHAGEGRRTLEGKEEKKNSFDFALWKKASPEHIMRWNSPWSLGFPGWHIECSAMSNKYLGEQFDIHGGGLDLLFPHHECEIAQSKAANHCNPAKYWMHNNMVTINGKKMGKSLGNAINLNEFFTGDHALLTQAYHPITVRFFFLQAHYRSTLDFSNEALQAAEKGLKKMINGLRTAKSMTYVPDANVSLDTELDAAIQQECQEVYDGLNADFNTAMSIAALYNLLKRINSFKAKLLALNSISQATFEKLVQTFVIINEEVLGISESKMLEGASPIAMLDAWMESYQQARANKDFALVDTIRANFKANQIIIKDSKEGSEWAYEE